LRKPIANPEDFVRSAALDVMQDWKVPPARIIAYDSAENRPIELEFIDFPSREFSASVAFVGIGRAVQILMPPLRDTNCPRRSRPIVGSEQAQVVVEDLNSRIAAVADIDVAVRVCRERMRRNEPSGPCAPSPGRGKESTAAIVFDDPRLVTVIDDKQIPIRIRRPTCSGISRRRHGFAVIIHCERFGK
jgi:hypothetical protein